MTQNYLNVINMMSQPAVALKYHKEREHKVVDAKPSTTDSNYIEEYDDDPNPNIKIVEYLKKKPHPIPEWEEHDKKVI